jgi:hypothetical protein
MFRYRVGRVAAEMAVVSLMLLAGVAIRLSMAWPWLG